MPLALAKIAAPAAVLVRLAPRLISPPYRLIGPAALTAPAEMVRFCVLVAPPKLKLLGVCVCPTLSLLKVEAAVKFALLGVNKTAPVVSMFKPGVVPVMLK